MAGASVDAKGVDISGVGCHVVGRLTRVETMDWFAVRLTWQPGQPDCWDSTGLQWVSARHSDSLMT
jgi:hypothetical protein